MNYFFVGTEAYRINERKRQIINETLGTINEMAVSTYNDLSDISVDDVVEDCMAFSFFAEKKVVIYENPSFLKMRKKKANASNKNLEQTTTATDETMQSENANEQYEEELDEVEKKATTDKEKAFEKLLNYLMNPNENTVLIIVYSESLESNPRIKQLYKYCVNETFNQVNEQDFRTIVLADIKVNELKLDNKATNELLNRLPLDIENWKSELEKLKSFPGKMDYQIIKELISKPLEDDSIELAKAVSDKRLSKAIEIYHELLVNNKYVTVPLISLLASQFRFSCQVKIMFEHNYTSQQMIDETKAHPYRIQKTMEASQGKNSKYYLKLLNDLSDLDQKIKTGRIDAVTGFELFIIQAVRG